MSNMSEITQLRYLKPLRDKYFLTVQAQFLIPDWYHLPLCHQEKKILTFLQQSLCIKYVFTQWHC